MADRTPQSYSLLPSGFNNGMNNMNNMLQQQAQHQHQQQQAQQQGDMHPGQSFSGLWNQQMQPQFRPRSGAGMAPQQQAQMNEIMRNHGMARAPSGQQQQQMNFPMGVGVPNMANQLPFNDQPSNQPNMTGGGFGGMQNSAMAQRQNNLLQSMPSSNVRQLEMMMQNTNNMNFAKLRPDQPQPPPFMNPGVNPNTQGDIFSPAMSNEGIRGPSPSHAPNMMSIMPPNGMAGGPMPPNQIQNPQRRPLTSAELVERTNEVRQLIAQREEVLRKLRSSPGFGNSPDLQHRAKQVHDDLLVKKRYLQSVMQYTMATQQAGAAGQGMGPANNGWMGAPSNQPQPFNNPTTAGRAGAGPPTPIQHPSQSPHPGGGVHGSPSLVKPQPPANQQAGLPQRTEAQQQANPQGPQVPQLPHQPDGVGLGGPFQIGQVGAGMNGQGGFQQQNPSAGPGTNVSPNGSVGMSNMGGGMPSLKPGMIAPIIMNIPPLEPGAFENNFKAFCQRRNRVFNPQTLQIDNKQLDLQSLHAVVMQEGGAFEIEARAAWDIIGGKLGFVQFPGSDTEPAKCGPGVAHQISTMYKEYLQPFDSVYIGSSLESRFKVGNMGMPNAACFAAMATGVPNASIAAGSAAMQMQAQARSRHQHQLGQLVQFAYQDAQSLRSRGLPENIVQMVETNRTLLQRAFDDQSNFSRGFRNPQQQGGNTGPQQGGMPQLHPDQQQNGAQANLQQANMNSAAVQSSSFGPVSGGQSQMPDRRMMGLSQGGLPNAGMNFMDNRAQGPSMGQIPPAPLPHQMQQAGLGQTSNPFQNTEQFNLATAYISRVKTDFTNNTLPNMVNREVPPEQRAQFNTVLEQLHRVTSDNENKLPMFFMLLNNSELIKKLVAITETISHQRQLLSSGSNRFIVTLETMRHMLAETNKIQEMFQVALQNNKAAQGRQNAVRQQQAQQQHLQNMQQQQQQHMQHMQQAGMNNNNSHPAAEMQRGVMATNLGPNIPPPPPSIPPPAGAHTPNLANQPLRQQPLALNPPPQPRRNQKPPNNTSTPAGISTPSPAPAAASTPTHNAPTPNTMGSPQLPKSPKAKAPAKKPARPPRRPSQASPAASGNAPTPQSQASPETASTPVQAHASVKRPREEDGSNATGPSPGKLGDTEAVANGPSPPKRAKMEPPSSIPPQSVLDKPMEPVKKAPEMASEVANLETPEQASEFLDQMTELLRTVATSSSEGQSGPSPEQFGETLEMLLKSVGGEPENGFGGDFGGPQSPGAGQSLSFDDLFDFSNMAEEEDYKDIPDLIRGSSTNASPESNNSEGENQALSSSSSTKLEPKSEDISDVLPAGLWKEIDGGEAAYFQTNEWKWDGPMSTVDQPWAIY